MLMYGLQCAAAIWWSAEANCAQTTHSVWLSHKHKHTYTCTQSFELYTEMILRYNTLALVFLSLIVLYLTQALPGGSEGLGWIYSPWRCQGRKVKVPISGCSRKFMWTRHALLARITFKVFYMKNTHNRCISHVQQGPPPFDLNQAPIFWLVPKAVSQRQQLFNMVSVMMYRVLADSFCDLRKGF